MKPLKRPRKPRRIPPTLYPLAVELEYAQALRGLVARWWRATIAALGQALQLDSQVAAGGAWRHDAGTVDDVLASARARWGQDVEGFRPTVEAAAAGADRVSRISLANQIEKATNGKPKPSLAIDLFKAEPQLEGKLASFAAENVRLIKDIGEDSATRLEATVLEWVKRGHQTRSLVDELEKEYSYDRRRATLIARDQIGKLQGQLSEVRQTAIGCKSYSWHTMQDNRVRKGHAGREGQIFLWANPPSDGHPGHPIACRCTATPVFDLADDFGLSPDEIAAEQAEQQANAARRRAQVAARQARGKEVKAELKARDRAAAEAAKLSPSYPPAPKPASASPRPPTVPARTPTGVPIPPPPAAAPAAPAARPARKPSQNTAQALLAREREREAQLSAESNARITAGLEARRRARAGRGQAPPAGEDLAPQIGAVYTHQALGPARVLSVKGQMAEIETLSGRKARTNIKLLGF